MNSACSARDRAWRPPARAAWCPGAGPAAAAAAPGGGRRPGTDRRDAGRELGTHARSGPEPKNSRGWSLGWSWGDPEAVNENGKWIIGRV